jgi:hypothetical protein
MHGLIRQVARFSCVTLGSIAGGVLGFVAGFLVAFAIGKSAFELASVYRPILERPALALAMDLFWIISLPASLFGFFAGGYYTAWLRFLDHNFRLSVSAS